MNNILVIDDDPSIRETFSWLLTPMGYRAYPAMDLNLDHKLLQKCPLVILDWNLRKSTGEKLFKKACFLKSKPKVIICTATPDRVNTCNPNIVGVLDKPIDLNKLIKLLDKCN